MDVRFVDGNPRDDRIAVIAALAIQAYLEAEAEGMVDPVTHTSRWVTAGRLEARGIHVSPIALRPGWRTQG
jgi:hypothetical protein